MNGEIAMRAVVCDTLGDETGLVMADLPPPVLRPGTVRIAVAAAGVNFADGLLIAGRYQDKVAPPFIPGFEIAGTVLATAEDVGNVRPGERVVALLDHGGFAEEAVARAEDVAIIPAGMDAMTAAALPVTYITAHQALCTRAGLAAGQTLLVHGAAGGVGLAAVEIGHALGAIVIATAGGSEKLAVAAAHGADFGIDHRDGEVAEAVKAVTGGAGADVVFDPVGGAMFDASLRCAKPGGRLVVIGFASGTVPQIPANILLVKNLTVIGYGLGGFRRLDPGGLAASFQALFAWYAAGRLRPEIAAVLPLDQAATALRRLKERGVSGKLVLKVKD